MGDWVTEILKKYGTAAIVFAIAVALVAWGLAHWVAQSGKEVSVLWGFVKYTKGTAENVITGETSAGKIADTSKRIASEPGVTSKGQLSTNQGEALPPIDLLVKNGVSKGNVSGITTTLRKERNLRELTAVESRKSVGELPKGTYFFFFPAWIDNSLSLGESVLSRVSKLSADRYKDRRGMFEIHKTNEGDTHIIAYLNEIHSSEISKLSGVDVHKVMISPYLWGQMTSLVSIPISRIQTSKHRYVEASKDDEVSVLDLTVR